MPDFAKLKATLAYTAEHLEQWRQGDWATPVEDDKGNLCGTTCCFAGNALLVEGYRFQWIVLGVFNGYDLILLGPDGQACGNDDDIMPLATRLLDLTIWQATCLFDGHNTFEDLERIIRGWQQ
jgi:hypothetical protein